MRLPGRLEIPQAGADSLVLAVVLLLGNLALPSSVSGIRDARPLVPSLARYGTPALSTALDLVQLKNLLPVEVFLHLWLILFPEDAIL